MSETNYTPIQLYRTTTASAAPSASNLADGELGINLTDEKLYFKNAGGTVKLLAANLMPVANGGTGLTSFTSGGVVYASSTSALTTGSGLVFDGSNLGIGVTPSAWAAGNGAIQLNGGAIYSGNANNFRLIANAYESSTGTKYITSTYATKYSQNDALGQHAWYNAPSGTAGNAITFTQAMTLDASGNLQLGTTTSKITLFSGSGNGLTIGGSSSPNIVVWSTADASYATYLGQSGANSYLQNYANGSLIFGTNATERMRLDSSGNLGIGVAPSYRLDVSVGATSGAKLFRFSGAIGKELIGYADGGGTGITNSDPYTGGSMVYLEGTAISFYNGGVNTVRIDSSGNLLVSGVYSATVGGTNRDVYVDNTGLLGYVSSTRESKINIAPISDAEWLLQLNPTTFNRRKKDEEGNYTEEYYYEVENGLIFDEVEPVNPKLCFYDEKDGGKTPAGIQYSQLIIPMLKMIQDLSAKVAALEAKQ